MQVFDYLINPKSKKDLILKSFYFQPETQEQEPLGELFVVGEMINALSTDDQFIEKIASQLKGGFYKNPQISAGEALRQALRNVNKYLKNLSAQGNTRWLGNFNLAVLSVKNSNINFTKIGDIKIFVLHNKEYLDITENLEFQNSPTNYQIQAFPNMASGSLSKDDKIIIVTQYLLDFFYQELAQMIIERKENDMKWLDKLLRQKKKELKDFIGILFFITYNKQKNKRNFWPFKKLKISKTGKNILLVLSFLLLLLFSYLIFR